MDTKNLKEVWQRFVEEEDGLSATEYAILFVVLVAVIVAGATALGGGITNLFNAARDALP